MEKLTIEQIQERMKWLGIMATNDTKPLSFKGFKQRVDVHKYGKKNRIFFLGFPKSNLFGFYPPISGTKEDEMKQSYNMYKKLVEGDITPYTDGDVQWGNCGIPIGYGDLRRVEDEMFD